jgi:hypothetical protein
MVVGDGVVLLITANEHGITNTIQFFAMTQEKVAG